MREKEIKKELTKEEQQVLNSIRPSRIVIPIVIGILAILLLAYRQFDMETLNSISWTGHIYFWIGISVFFLLFRHFILALRLKRISGNHFSLAKSIELIFIWEFSSAVSPTSLGGSIVAFFMLAQERLSAARTATIVIYTIIIDSAFFVFIIPFSILVFGGLAVRPNAESLMDTSGWGATLIGLTLAMGLYGTFFLYGMFVDPRKLKWLLIKMASTRWTRRWRERAFQIGDELILASRDIGGKSWIWHVEMCLYTLLIWFARFMILNVLIIAFVPDTGLGFMNQFMLWTRSVSLYMIMAFSPTPGASGLAELMFDGFLSDFIPLGIGIMIALVWRIITYYTYLVGGIFVIPNWIRKVLNRRLNARNPVVETKVEA